MKQVDGAVERRSSRCAQKKQEKKAEKGKVIEDFVEGEDPPDLTEPTVMVRTVRQIWQRKHRGGYN
jgi:hypothetical protein